MTRQRIQRVASEDFVVYQTKPLSKIAGVGRLFALDRFIAERGVAPPRRIVTRASHLAFHPWRQGWVDVGTTEPEADYAALGWLADGPPDLAGIVTRAMIDFAAIQNPWELERLLERVAQRPPRTVLEIGTSSGGTLFALSQVAASDALIISIDLPERSDSPAISAALPRVLRSLARPTQTLHAIRDRSTLYAVRSEVIAQLGGKPLDLLVIDADHTYGGVRSDFEMYAPLVGPGGLVAMHDVLVAPENSGRGYEVGVFWREIAKRERGELIADPDGSPGLLDHAGDRSIALGWGLLPR